MTQKFPDAPDMISEPSCHGRGAGKSHMLGLTQLMTRKTEIVAASDQIHPRLQSEEPTSGMAKLARQAGEQFSKGGIQALDKSGSEDGAHLRAQEELRCLSPLAMGTQSCELAHLLR